MAPRRLPAVFMRGGTSKAVMFHRRDLPQARHDWDRLFLAVMGSPDTDGRQLDGMGGGISSLSKVCVVGPPTRADADVDYTFAQVLIREAKVDYSGNCGNMSSAIGPFAVDEGLVQAGDGHATVRIHNTNTGKIIRATFEVLDGRARVDGDFTIPGVAGSGSPIRLDFLDPGGASTGKLLPTKGVAEVLDIPGLGAIEASMVDAANACVFVDAAAVGARGNELPEEIESDAALMERLALVRSHASVRMGIAPDLEAARAKTMIPFVALVSPPQRARMLSGEMLPAADADLTVRVLSNGQPHRALPLTVSLCTAVAARIPETLVARRAARVEGETLRLGMPSGVLAVGARVEKAGEEWRAVHGSFYRTARRLFEGAVYPRPC